MNAKNYSKTIRVKANPEDAFRALTTGYDQWWTITDNQFTEIGDRIKFTFPPHVSYWTFEAKRLEPNNTVELECVEAFHIIMDKPDAPETEWLGTRARWRIEPCGEETDIHFEHEGLTPDLHCYEVCETGWDMFFVNSLKAYLDTGIGEPHSADGTS